jgi:diguanylate cyclase (GGDEF)-like protein
MQTLAGTDMLTGLPNRPAMTEHLDSALASARRHGHAVVVALFDIDHFKRINDTHGHAAGDKALIAVGRVLSSQLRASDHLGRWGGEEFLLVAPETPMHAGMELAERLRSAIADDGCRCAVERLVATVGACRPARAKIRRMDIEEINAVGSLLADLSARTQQLRGYL